MKLFLTIAGVAAVITMLLGGNSPNSFIHATPGDNSLILIKSGTGRGSIYLESEEKLSNENRVAIKTQEGSLLTLRAEAAPGSRFAGWSGVCKGQASSCTIIVGSQTQITAEFNLIR